MLDALRPFAERGVPVVGLEPPCLYTLRDEFQAMVPGEDTDKLANNAFLFEEFLSREHETGTLSLDLESAAGNRVMLHGHCHQKAFDAMSAVETVLRLIPDLEVETIRSGCCGMAGAFGYDADNYDVSMKMGELDLLPAVRNAGDDDLIVAAGTSCRHQIRDGADRMARHPARALEAALKDGQRDIDDSSR
jgi:Fe-S oxidoreductase